MSRPLRVDLHSHTTRSDGKAPPRDLIRLALEARLDVLAVTDHDTVEAIPECIEEARGTGLRLIPGIEISSLFQGHDVHVLGIGIDPGAPALLARLEGLHASRRERVGKICVKLAELGVALDPKEVLAEAGGKSVGRPHVARALVKRGVVPSIEEAFRKFLAAGSPANVPAHEWSPREAAELILAHGGLPVMAHPGFLEGAALVERILDSAPLAGLEVFHRYRSSTRHLEYLDLARRRNLLVTGGSDFHGDRHRNNAGLGESVCPPVHWKDFEKRLGPG